MAHQTDCGGTGSSPPPRGPVLAVLATAPRPGLALPGACPPCTPAEAGALATAWLKRAAQELPGLPVVLFGQPADAMPMLRYFAGPGVELRGWPAAAAADPTRAVAAAAAELFAAGHGPVVVRSAAAPEPTEADLLACTASARTHLVLAPDQHGVPWLVGYPSLAAVTAPHAVDRRRGPWARTVATGQDLRALLDARDARRPTLPVPNLQAALQWYEHALGSQQRDRGAGAAHLTLGGADLTLAECSADHVPDGCWLPSRDPPADFSRWSSRIQIAADDQPVLRTDGGIEGSVVDPFGNRLAFGTPPNVR